MAIKVSLKNIHHPARKLTAVSKPFGKLNLDKALIKVSVMPQKAAYHINKLLKMAKAASLDKAFNPEEMVITQIFANEGPKMKRFRPQARGRMNKYTKHISHLTIEVDRFEPIKEVAKATKAKSDVPNNKVEEPKE